jgi:hypothetical protein
MKRTRMGTGWEGYIYLSIGTYMRKAKKNAQAAGRRVCPITTLHQSHRKTGDGNHMVACISAATSCPKQRRGLREKEGKMMDARDS